MLPRHAVMTMRRAGGAVRSLMSGSRSRLARPQRRLAVTARCRSLHTHTAHSRCATASAGRESGTASSSDQKPLFADPKASILDAALPFIPTHGWSDDALAAGAESLGFPAVANGMFPGGAADLVAHAMDLATRHMCHEVAALDLESMTVNQRIAAGVKARIKYTAQWQASWPQAMAVGALPPNAVGTASHLGMVVDEIWYLAGDRSTDMHWYSRRGLLLGVYASTELFMLTDTSPGLEDTWAFLERRIQEVENFGDQVGKSDSILTAVASGLSALASGALSVGGPALQELYKVDAAEAYRVVTDVVQRAAGGNAGPMPPPPSPSASPSSTPPTAGDSSR